MLNRLPKERAGENQIPRILHNFILHFVSIVEEIGSWVDTDNPKAAC